MDDSVEQFSPQSTAALRDAAQRLSEMALRYVRLTEDMSGSTSELMRIHHLNDELAAAVADVNEKILDHTGTRPLWPHTFDDTDDEPFEDDEEDDPEIEVDEYLSVVSRWDIAVTNRDEVLEAARRAHLRDNPVDGEADAELAVPDPGAALMASLGQSATIWFNTPGIEPLRGVHVGIVPTDVPEPQEIDIDSIVDNVTPPEGAVFFSEVW
jgi:hypothetical protein